MFLYKSLIFVLVILFIFNTWATILENKNGSILVEQPKIKALLSALTIISILINTHYMKLQIDLLMIGIQNISITITSIFIFYAFFKCTYGKQSHKSNLINNIMVIFFLPTFLALEHLIKNFIASIL